MNRKSELKEFEVLEIDIKQAGRLLLRGQSLC